jgi:hypothetical protein
VTNVRQFLATFTLVILTAVTSIAEIANKTRMIKLAPIIVKAATLVILTHANAEAFIKHMNKPLSEYAAGFYLLLFFIGFIIFFFAIVWVLIQTPSHLINHNQTSIWTQNSSNIYSAKVSLSSTNGMMAKSSIKIPKLVTPKFKSPSTPRKYPVYKLKLQPQLKIPQPRLKYSIPKAPKIIIPNNNPPRLT